MQPSPRAKAEILRRCWEILLEHQRELAELIVREHGKPLADAMGEITYAAEFFRWNAEEAVRIHGSISTAPAGTNKIIVHHPPVGVVVIVTPWNFPAAMITRKLAPALAAGNGVVIKPPKETPLTALRITELITEAGVPGGLVNVVATQDAGAWFDAAVDHPAVRMVSFTGSTEVGRVLLRRCADRVLKTVMELGGNAPFVVFDDADLDADVEGAMTAKMRHSAETCTAANRRPLARARSCCAEARSTPRRCCSSRVSGTRLNSRRWGSMSSMTCPGSARTCRTISRSTSNTHASSPSL